MTINSANGQRKIHGRSLIGLILLLAVLTAAAAYYVLNSGGGAAFRKKADLQTNPSQTAMQAASPAQTINVCSSGAEDVYLEGSTAYIVAGNCFEIVNISDLARPRRIARLSTLSHADRVHVSGTRAYIADWNEGLIIIDMQNLSAPREVARFKLPGPAWSVFVKDRFAYVTVLRSGLHIMDISDPVKPRQVALYSQTLFSHDVRVVDHVAYVADTEKGLVILDITRPDAPRELGIYKTRLSRMYTEGKIAYLADGGLLILDVRNPASIKKIGRFTSKKTGRITSRASINNVFVHDKYAYVVEGMSELENTNLAVLDISKPSDPVEVGRLSKEYTMKNIAVAGGHAFVASGDHGLDVYDVSDPAKPTERGTIAPATLGEIRAIAVVGTNAYAVSYTRNELVVIDISNHEYPRKIGGCNLDGGGTGIVISNTLAYVATNFGVRIVDIAVPAYPVVIGTYIPPGTSQEVKGLALKGTMLYVTGLGEDLAIVDVSVPAKPRQVAYTGSGSWAWDLFVSGTYAYVASRNHGLKTVDISDPGAVRIASIYSVPNYDPGMATSVSVQGGYAFVAFSQLGLRILDVRNPVSPVEVGTYNPHGYVDRVTIAGNKAFVGSSPPGSGKSFVNVLDIQDPSSPKAVAEHQFYGLLWDIVVDDKFLYVISDSGLSIISQ